MQIRHTDVMMRVIIQLLPQWPMREFTQKDNGNPTLQITMSQFSSDLG